jgi:WD repeat-containing protein 19
MIERLNDLEGGAELVKQTKAREPAKQIALLFMQQRNYSKAVEFYLLAGLQSMAFNLAQEHQIVEHFSSLVQDEAPAELCKQFI